MVHSQDPRSVDDDIFTVTVNVFPTTTLLVEEDTLILALDAFTVSTLASSRNKLVIKPKNNFIYLNIDYFLTNFNEKENLEFILENSK